MLQAIETWWYDVRNSNRKSSNILNYQSSPQSHQLYWFEFLGMFIFVFLQSCTNSNIGIHLQISLILAIAIPMCAKISGAHYNPAVTLSNCLCRFNKGKYNFGLFWMYIKAQTYAALAALALAYLINDGFFAGLALPEGEVTALRLSLSEFVSTAILVFYIQLISNSETSLMEHDGQKYFFIIAFVFVARKTAYISSFAINPAITLATALIAILNCNWTYLNICVWYLVGDLAGSIFGTWFYNQVYVSVLYGVRYGFDKDNEENEGLAGWSNIEVQSSEFDNNYGKVVKSKEDLEIEK